MIAEEATDMPIETFGIGVYYSVEGFFNPAVLVQSYDFSFSHRVLRHN